MPQPSDLLNSRELTPDVTRLVSKKEIEEHVSNGECWITIHGNVYNVTNYKHPGGAAILWKYNGKDCTSQFDDVGHSLESLIYDIDSSCLVGVNEERHLAKLKDQKLADLLKAKKLQKSTRATDKQEQKQQQQQQQQHKPLRMERHRSTTSLSSTETYASSLSSDFVSKEIWAFCSVFSCIYGYLCSPKRMTEGKHKTHKRKTACSFSDHEKKKYKALLSLVSSIMFFGGLLVYLKLKRNSYQKTFQKNIQDF